MERLTGERKGEREILSLGGQPVVSRDVEILIP